MPLQMSHEDIDEIFTYHQPVGDQAGRYVAIRDEAKRLAHRIIDLTPTGPLQTLAIRRLQEAVMWANASIAMEKAVEEAVPDAEERTQRRLANL